MSNSAFLHSCQILGILAFSVDGKFNSNIFIYSALLHSVLLPSYSYIFLIFFDNRAVSVKQLIISVFNASAAVAAILTILAQLCSSIWHRKLLETALKSSQSVVSPMFQIFAFLDTSMSIAFAFLGSFRARISPVVVARMVSLILVSVIINNTKLLAMLFVLDLKMKFIHLKRKLRCARWHIKCGLSAVKVLRLCQNQTKEHANLIMYSRLINVVSGWQMLFSVWSCSSTARCPPSGCWRRRAASARWWRSVERRIWCTWLYEYSRWLTFLSGVNTRWVSWKNSKVGPD